MCLAPEIKQAGKKKRLYENQTLASGNGSGTPGWGLAGKKKKAETALVISFNLTPGNI